MVHMTLEELISLLKSKLFQDVNLDVFCYNYLKADYLQNQSLDITELNGEVEIDRKSVV